MASDDFYGIEITRNPDGTTTVDRRGGYEPYPLDDLQLVPFIELAKASLIADGLWPESEPNPACMAT